MSTLPFRYTIGLEVHCELATATKMFCRCANKPFGSEPNSNTCPVCLALPGTLPVPNKEAVKKTILVGKALGSEIPAFAKFDRKHYFYPDSPKGYQISQYDLPFCVGGHLDILDTAGKVSFTVDFERVHLEEDAGKLMHTGKEGYSRVDLNRAGVPLIEMVTRPVIHSPEQARAFMQELRLLVKRLGVSEADMEKGHMRCDANVSIQFMENGVEVSGPITEIKNVNSTRGVERALTVEAQRQYDEWMANGPIRQRVNKITVGWDEDTNSVQINRAKEAAKDYRYFPEPDMPPVEPYLDAKLNPDGMVIPELPNGTRLRYLEYGIAMGEIDVLINNDELRSRFEGLKKDGLPAKQAANWLLNIPEAAEFTSVQLKELMDMAAAGGVLFSQMKEKMSALLEATRTGSRIHEAVESLGLLQRYDASVVQSAVEAVLDENPQAVQDFKDGKEKILGFIVGQVMKKAKGTGSPQKIQELVREVLSKR